VAPTPFFVCRDIGCFFTLIEGLSCQRAFGKSLIMWLLFKFCNMTAIQNEKQNNQPGLVAGPPAPAAPGGKSDCLREKIKSAGVLARGQFSPVGNSHPGRLQEPG
jgi:hypothetical protein